MAISSLSQTPSSLTLSTNPPRLSHFTLQNPILLLRLPAKPSSISIHALRYSPNPINPTSPHDSPPKLPHTFLGLAASLVLFLGFGVRLCSAAPTSTNLPPLVVHEDRILQDEDSDAKETEDEELKAAFEKWKTKTYALTVPLRIVSLQGSIPQSWVKDFMRAQGRRLKLQANFYGSLEGIFSQLSVPSSKPKVNSSSIVAADLVSVGDSWLSYAIKKGLIEPMRGVEDQDWFKCLSDKWKVYLRRNNFGEIDPQGELWAAPYRWGCMVIAYKKSKFQKYKLDPIKDWTDLWRPELAGRISMVNSPREVIGAVLKYMGASYNTENMDTQIAGGRVAVQQNLALFGKQVRLFDSTFFLKAFGVGDVWVAVGWSSDVLPAVKRMSNVAVIVPKSGSSLWADLWAIPAASRLETNQIGGRVRGPSPLIHQWIEFCLQAARALPFKQGVIPGAPPAALQSKPVEVHGDLLKGKPRLDTNLIAGVPPAEILARCEFLEPLCDATLADYEWLIAGMQKPDSGFINRIKHYISSLNHNFSAKAP